MSEFDATLLTLLSGICVVLLGGVIVALVSISSRLSRIEKQLRESVSRPEADEETLSEAESSSGGSFEIFLNEDASRRSLSKGEQFSAYRKWRRQNGMNWSNS